LSDTLRSRLTPVVLVSLVLGLFGQWASVPVVASWAPRSDESPQLARDVRHTGFAPGTSRFRVSAPGANDAAKVKWERDVEYPALYPPAVADLDRDGKAELVVTNSDLKLQVKFPFDPTKDIQFTHRVQAVRGVDGSDIWSRDEPNSWALINGANVGDVDADGQAEVLYWQGNPLTGTPSDSNLTALAHTGSPQWRFSDATWGSQRLLGIVNFAQSANVDADANSEAVFPLNLADITITRGGPGFEGCSDDKAQINALVSNNNYRVYALNGEAGSASAQWAFRQNPGLTGSTPAIADLNGDGKLDAVWGSGAPAGPLIDGGCDGKVSLDDSAEDNHIYAVSGASVTGCGPPLAPACTLLWSKTIEDPLGQKRPVAASPVVAGTTAGGDPILAFLIPVADYEPAARDPNRNILLALNGKTGAELWRTVIREATIILPAAADLDGDGQPEIIVAVDNRLATFRNRTGADFWSQGAGDFRGIVMPDSISSAQTQVADIDGDGVKEIVGILDGSGSKFARVFAVSGDTGVLEWTANIIMDDVTGGPMIADVDNDDDGMLEIAVSGGSLTVTDDTAHHGHVTVFEPNAPDLKPLAITVDGSKLRGELQTVHASVQNTGTRDATAMIRLTDNGAVVSDQTATVAAGATATVDFPWTPSSAGGHDLKAIADPAKAVQELNETNNEFSQTVVIKAKPTANFTFSPASPKETDTVAFTDASTDPDGTIVSRSWSCTDGFTSAATNPSHKFADGGSYSCSLTVTDNDGLTGAVTKPIAVSHVSPVADFTSASVGGGNVQFTDTSTHPNAADAPPAGWTYAWDFESDDVIDSSERNPLHDYGATPGSVTATLMVTDNDAKSSSVSKAVTPNPTPSPSPSPVPSITPSPEPTPTPSGSPLPTSSPTPSPSPSPSPTPDLDVQVPAAGDTFVSADESNNGTAVGVTATAGLDPGMTASLTATATDAGGHTVSAGPVTVSDDSPTVRYRMNMSGLDDGPVTVAVSGPRSDGEIISDDASFTLDLHAPSSTVESGDGDIVIAIPVFEFSTLDITGTVSDGVGIAGVAVVFTNTDTGVRVGPRIADLDGTPTAADYELAGVYLEPGQWDATIYGYDFAGNTEPGKTITFSVL
jgi:PKD repeat protein